MNTIDFLELEQMKKNIPVFRVGDTVKVQVKIVEGDKQRIQAYQGVVIARQNGGIRESFTVRKISNGIGVERVFPLHSPVLCFRVHGTKPGSKYCKGNSRLPKMGLQTNQLYPSGAYQPQ